MEHRKTKQGRWKDSFLLSPAATNPAATGGRIELCGNRRAVIEGSGGVLEYDTVVVRLRLGRFSVRITGRNLRIRCMTGTTMIVEGFLSGVEYLL